MTAIDARIAHQRWQCPWCPTVVEPGDVIWPLKIGTTESSACSDCAWRSENGMPLFREAPPNQESS